MVKETMKENNSPAWLNFHTLHGDVPYLKDTLYTLLIFFLLKLLQILAGKRD